MKNGYMRRHAKSQFYVVKASFWSRKLAESKRILVRQFYRISEILILRPIRKAILGPVSLRKRHFAVSFFEQLEVQI